MKAVVAAFNQEKALVGAYSVITNLRMELFETLVDIVRLVSCHDVQTYLTIGLPQLLEPNMTGITIDLNKMSWISETTRF